LARSVRGRLSQTHNDEISVGLRKGRVFATII